MVCLLCDFKILLTVFNLSYNCKTSHYLGRNQLLKPFLILPFLPIIYLLNIFQIPQHQAQLPQQEAQLPQQPIKQAQQPAQVPRQPVQQAQQPAQVLRQPAQLPQQQSQLPQLTAQLVNIFQLVY